MVAWASDVGAGVAGAAANVSVTAPTVANGDALYAVCMANNTSASWTAPAAFGTAQLAKTSVGSAIFRHDCDGTEGGTSYTFTRSNTTAAADVILIRVSNPGTTAALDVLAGAGGASSTIALSDLGTVPSNCLLLQAPSRSTTGAATWSPPGTATERTDADTSGTALRYAVGDEIVSGATGTRTWTQTGTGATRGAIIAINPLNHNADTTVSATGSLTSAAVRGAIAAVTAAATAAVALTGSVGKSLDTTATTTASFTAEASVAKAIDTTVSATGSATVDARLAAQTGTEVAATGSFTAGALRDAPAQTTATATGSLAVEAQVGRVEIAEVDMTATGATILDAVHAVSGGTNVTATGTLATTGHVAKTAELDQQATAAAVIEARADHAATSDVTATAESLHDVVLDARPGASIVAVAATSFGMRLDQVAQVAATATGSVGVVLKVPASPTPAERVLAVDSESRALAVDSESRVLAIPSESRVLEVRP